MSFDLLNQGGIVLYVIVACGALAFGVFIERSLHLHRARIRFEDFLKGIFNILRKNNITEALAICAETPGPVAHIVGTAIRHRLAPKDDLRQEIERASLGEISRMERRLVVVATVAQIAPLLGLLGTVLGMVESLLVLQQAVPIVPTTEVIAGLMKALLTTAAGLTVAIPCYAAFNLLVVKIDRIVLDMESAGAEVMAFLVNGGDPAAGGNGHGG